MSSIWYLPFINIERNVARNKNHIELYRKYRKQLWPFFNSFTIIPYSIGSICVLKKKKENFKYNNLNCVVPHDVQHTPSRIIQYRTINVRMRESKFSNEIEMTKILLGKFALHFFFQRWKICKVELLAFALTTLTILLFFF